MCYLGRGLCYGNVAPDIGGQTAKGPGRDERQRLRMPTAGQCILGRGRQAF